MKIEEVFNQGAAFMKEGKFREAVKKFDIVIRQDPTLYNAWYNKAYALYNLKKFKQAYKAVQKAIQLSKALFSFFNQLIILFNNFGS